MAKDYFILMIQFGAHSPPVLTVWRQPQQQIFQAKLIGYQPLVSKADLVTDRYWLILGRWQKI